MRARSAIISLVCAVGLVLSGCSSDIPGSARLPGAGSGAGSDPTAGGPSGLPTGAPQTSSGHDAGSGTNSGDEGSGSDNGGSSTGGGAGGIPGLPSNLPSGLPSGLPTDLGSIPGVAGGCMAILGILTLPVLFLGPTLGGQPLTQEQVDKAFSGLGDVPAELQQPVQALHDAAVQAIGKSGADAAAILDSDQVNSAMDAINNYADTQCGGS